MFEIVKNVSCYKIASEASSQNKSELFIFEKKATSSNKISKNLFWNVGERESLILLESNIVW